ncbi:MAG: hypothetical protein OEX02_17270 [Cyclobacteriaceae bacterium]|nr:hypothetical protein [Cyclobacteriaceae bacterium]
MKIPVIKKLVEKFSLSELEEADEAIINEKQPAIEVEGEDEGEQLTHVMAAVWIKTYLKSHEGVAFKDALREYTKKVRTSIS